MIIGNGVDIIDNKRIEKSLKIKGFKKRLFTLNEIKQSKKNSGESYMEKLFFITLSDQSLPVCYQNVE